MAEETGWVRSPDGVNLAIREWPRPGPGLLLAHGLASTSHIFDRVVPLLTPHFHVVAYDQRGHGKSGKPGARFGFDHTAPDLLAVIDQTKLRRPVAVGHSWGGNVVLEAAARAPRSLSGAILLDGGFTSLRHMDWPTVRTALSPPPIAGMRLREFLSLVRRHMGRSVGWRPEVEALFLSLVHVNREGRIRPRLSRPNHMRVLHALWGQDPMALLRTIEVPTLALATRLPGSRGPDPEFGDSKRLAARAIRRMEGPIRFEWIEGIHDIPLQRPRAVAHRIRRFAREIARG
jgi:pimeloyl-ACP methyl ester carboxylesterase